MAARKNMFWFAEQPGALHLAINSLKAKKKKNPILSNKMMNTATAEEAYMI